MYLGLVVLPKWCLLLKRESFNSIFKSNVLLLTIYGNVINQSWKQCALQCIILACI